MIKQLTTLINSNVTFNASNLLESDWYNIIHRYTHTYAHINAPFSPKEQAEPQWAPFHLGSHNRRSIDVISGELIVAIGFPWSTRLTF